MTGRRWFRSLRYRSGSAAVLSLALLVAAGPALAGDADDDRVRWQKPVVRSTGLMAFGLVALQALGETDSNPSFANFKSAWERGPRRDDDSDFYNLVLHPLWGSETYLRAREANMGRLGSIGFSFGASITWEYVFESWTEHPSSQDLVYTTGVGWMLGELRYRLKRRTGRRAHWLIDPLDLAIEHVRIGFANPRGSDPSPIMTLHFAF